MYYKVSFSKFYSILLGFVFLMGIQTTSEAQIRIQNDSGCDLYIAAGQSDMTTINPCDGCVLIGLNFVADGGVLNLPVNLSCGQQQWQAVYWTESFGSSFGLSYNPALTCGLDVTTPCGGTTGNWILSTATGVGPAFVSIQ